MSKAPPKGAVASGSRSVVAYYEGAYGATLRIDVQSIEDLSEIKTLIGRLASGEATHLLIEDLLSIAMEPPVQGLTLRTVAGPRVINQRGKVNRVAAADGTLTFEWQQTSSEWEDTEGLVDGLLEVGRRGESAHQYLTDDSVGDVLIELALKERVAGPQQ